MEDLKKLKIEEIENGYVERNGLYKCIYCATVYSKNEIFNIDDRFFNAEFAMKFHLQSEHGGSFKRLIELDKKVNSLTELQKSYFELLYANKSDKEIAMELQTSTSIVRNQRFTFKEKATQAKIYLSIYNLANNESNFDDFIPISIHAKQVDERYSITQDEAKEVIQKFTIIGDKMMLKSIPKKEKYKIIILTEIMKLFSIDKKYTEQEVNSILKEIYSDYVSLRRQLIEYGFMKRNSTGSEYWCLR